MVVEQLNKEKVMSGKIVVLAIVGILLFVVVGFLMYVVGIANKDKSQDNLIAAKKQEQKSNYDNMWKKISQVAQVTDAQKDALKEIFVSAKTGDSGQGGTMIKLIHQAFPNVDTSTFNNLQNIITSSRDSFTFTQKELIDLKRENDNLHDLFPSSVVLSFLGRQKSEITIVTSSRTENAIETGKDDDVSVFRK